MLSTLWTVRIHFHAWVAAFAQPCGFFESVGCKRISKDRVESLDDKIKQGIGWGL